MWILIHIDTNDQIKTIISGRVWTISFFNTNRFQVVFDQLHKSIFN